MSGANLQAGTMDAVDTLCPHVSHLEADTNAVAAADLDTCGLTHAVITTDAYYAVTVPLANIAAHRNKFGSDKLTAGALTMRSMLAAAWDHWRQHCGRPEREPTRWSSVCLVHRTH